MLKPHGILLLLLGGLIGCNDQTPCPQWSPSCRDASRAPSASALQYASTGEIRDLLGKADFKVTFTYQSHLYLLTPGATDAVAPVVKQVDQGNEGQGGSVGDPASPALSPDGSWLAFAGDYKSQGNTRTFVVKAETPLQPRLMVARDTGKFCEPRWHAEGNTLWLYGANRLQSNAWNPDSTVDGATFRAALRGSSLDSFGLATVAGRAVPGAFKGGITINGHWAVTSYGKTVLWNTTDNSRTLLNDGEQQCNPSMNPYDSSALHGDYFMILGFGGQKPVPAIGGDVIEGQHEHLWIWNRANKAVWKADLPSGHSEWQRPRWSTHPDFATALAKRSGSNEGFGYDLYLVKISDNADLANASEASLQSAKKTLRLAWDNDAGFESRDWSHMWVAR
jgi:hypothetical protein